MSNKNIKNSNNQLENKHNQIWIIRIIVLLFCILMIGLIIYRINLENNTTLKKEQQISNVFSSINLSNFANITKYTVYGTHLNIEGTLEINKISGISIKSVNLVLKNLNNEETAIKSTYNYSDNILEFSTSNEINSGINLENLSNNTYYIFIKVSFSNEDIKYYSLVNTTSYSNITYYTLTKNKSNSKIDIIFNKYNDSSYMSLNINNIDKLPDNIYDIVIDPGHGGADCGAVSGTYTESSISLNCALKLKSKLESLGLKVLLTRDGTENSTYTESNMYDENGRVTLTNKSKAKLMLSLHLNSTTDIINGGLEIYAPSNCNLDFAQRLANNTSTYADISFSTRKTFKKYDGVYVQNFTNADILAFKSKAIKSKYDPYNLTTSTPYLYIIREIGGICTNAFVDGRNTNYGANKYYNSNIGIEGYLIELGYIKVNKDLQNILSNSDKYIEGITESIETFYNL